MRMPVMKLWHMVVRVHQKLMLMGVAVVFNIAGHLRMCVIVVPVVVAVPVIVPHGLMGMFM